MSTRHKLTKRPADERGLADHGWLKSRHSFSFGNYYDPAHLGFRKLRVINDDRVDGGRGFGSHPHRDMEIFSYVIDGALEHKDSLGNGRIIRAGEFQYMSAGSGVVHSEFNPSPDTPAHFLQIWIEPASKGGEPRYQELKVSERRSANALAVLASSDGRDGSIAMRQEAEIWFGDFHAGHEQSVTLPPAMPHAWIQVIRGTLAVEDESLIPGDGLAIEAETFRLQATAACEFLLFFLS